jgi:hypothetical protein
MMQLAHSGIAEQSHGLTFYKLLGSGGEDGFSWKPSFSVYGFLGVWEDASFAEEFITCNAVMKEYRQRSTEAFTTYMHSIQSHGSWSGTNPFQTTSANPSGKIAVITRATIYPGKVLGFWTKVSKVSSSLENYEGRRFSIGIGEWPLVQQATFSIWDSFEHMAAYAYKNPHHKRVIELTRQKKWYKEELFARFSPVKVKGFWDGRNVNFLD